MTRQRKLLAYLAVVCAAMGCTDTTVGPVITGGEAEFSAAGTPDAVSVLNWNIYVGADVDEVIAALLSPDPEDDIPTLLAAVDVLQRTAFPVRAEAIADVIAKKKPDVVGLQEVWTLDVDLVALGLPVTIELDFLTVLQGALAARGLSYDVAVNLTNTDAAPFPGIRVVDHDVILVNPSRVTVLSTAGQSFLHNIGEVALGVEIKRGWVTVTGAVNGSAITFVNTHLEAGPGEQLTLLRAAQAQELMAILGGVGPVVLMGDLNDADTSPMYQIVLGAGFTDLWTALRPGRVGLTCCHLPDLSNTFSAFEQRIDYVLTRGFGQPPGKPRGVITILGDDPGDRVTGPAHAIWPSDHAGLAVRLLAPPSVDLVAP